MLTDSAVKKLTAKPTPYRVFDGGGSSGFGIQVTPAGAKSWFLRFRWHGRRRFLTLGHFPHTGAAAAREKARAALARLDAGTDPAMASAGLGTFAELLAAWAAQRRDAGARQIEPAWRMIKRNCAALLDTPAAAVTASDCRAVLAAVHQRGARTLANRLRAHLHSLFRYGIQHDHDPRTLAQSVRFGLTANPIDAIPRDPGAERVGERVLTWGEVRELWHTTRMSWPARQACRLLVATGARVNEVCGASWSEFDPDAALWTLPASRSKNKRAHLLPLPPMAVELLGELRAVFDGDWLFPYRNRVGATKPWGITALSHAIRAAGYDWTGRDLRRTFKTLAGAVGLEKSIRDRIQNHALSDVSAKHYDRHAYLPEKRRAMETWCDALAARIAGDNVVHIKSRTVSDP